MASNQKTSPRKETKSNGNGSGPWVGRSLPRKEDERLLRGHGRFTDDRKMFGMLYLGMVRSPYAHAKVKRVDVSSAEGHSGVVCTLTGPELTKLVQPFLEIGPEPGSKIVDYPMAVERVRYQGEPVAVVVAESPMIAEDAAELVQVDYEALDVVVDAVEALKDKVILHESVGSNMVWHGLYDWGDVDKAFKEAAHIVEIDHLHLHRFTATPVENNAIIAQWDTDGDIHYWCNNAFPTFALQFLAPSMGVPINRIHIKTEDIGGSFGAKITSYPQMEICALASRKAGGRPVKWIETRSEHMVGSAHANERTFLNTRVALDKNGVITGIESKHIDDCGSHPRYEPLGCVIWSQVTPGAYCVQNVRVDFTQVCTNKCPVGPIRGYSRLQQLWFVERVIDICGHELDIPSDEIRLRNYIKPEEYPYTTPNGCVYDSGDFPKMLDLAKNLIGWDDWKTKQQKARQEGRMLGIGIGTALDSGTNNFGQARIINPQVPFSGQSEAANAKLDIDGSITVSLGSTPQGQGHETTTAQVVADVLNVDPSMVTVQIGFDTDRNVHTGHSGTYASQFAVTGLSAAHGAAQKLKAEMKELAAFALEAKEDDLEFGVGEMGPEVRVKGTDKSIAYWGLANFVNVNNGVLPAELADLTLNCRYVYRPPFKLPDIERKFGNLCLTYSSQLHIAVIEVDKDTYQPKILDYAAVDDCGTLINPMIVEGQVLGATAHGIGAALHEICSYDAGGNMLTSTFSDYAPITAMGMPNVRYGNIQSPSPFSYSGAKGMGEGGGAAVHTISAAIQDALFEKGVIVHDSFNNADAVFRAIKQAEAGQSPVHVKVKTQAAGNA